MDNKALIKCFFTTPTKADAASVENIPVNTSAQSPRIPQHLSPTPALLTPRRPLQPKLATPRTSSIPSSSSSSSAATTLQPRHRQQQPPPPFSYEIAFPPGPMGLELEPVIISSERQLGCRVKDFYFSLDHSGVDPTELQVRVSPGDVVSHVDGVCVLSLRFAEVLDMLRQIRHAQRVVAFKNISASCTFRTHFTTLPVSSVFPLLNSTPRHHARYSEKV